MKKTFTLLTMISMVLHLLWAQAPRYSDEQLAALKSEIEDKVQERAKMAQVMVDKIFSFAELGFQEFESSRYLTDILKEHGISGVPTAWWAKWGSGKPVIALGSDLDCIPKASQKPGVAYHDPIIDGAPGHGEGHNSGIPLNIISAITVKEVMEREGLQGTLILWPGIIEYPTLRKKE